MSLHDPKFKYRPSFDTDVRRTVRRVQKQMREDAARKKHEEAEAQAKVAPIGKGRRQQC